MSELPKADAGKADSGVTDWARGVPAPLMFMSVISLHELEHGILLAERRDTSQGAILRAWLEGGVMPAVADRFLPVTTDLARRAAAMHVPDPAPFRDALIAATARVHGISVVTRNVRDFERFEGVGVINPWS